MSLQVERLSSLIEFCHQSAKLRGRPPTTVTSYGNFSPIFENDLRDIPGVHLNASRADDDDELWLSVDRVYETKLPEVLSPWLTPWVIITQNPHERPTLKSAVLGTSLIEAGTHVSESSGEDGLKINPGALVSLDEFNEAMRVQNLFNDYVETKWILWANEERKRLKTIQLYAQLFALKQLEGGIVETQLELVWGVGIGVWKTDSATISYPLLSRLVELTLNPITSALEIRPRDVDPRIELDWYAAQDNLGVLGLEKAAKKFFGELLVTFSPFDKGTFEPLLRTAVTHLDANGVYWPSQVQPSDRLIPKADDNLKVTDTWVLFARPRSNNSYLQDLERLQITAESLEELPPAVAAMLTDPSMENPELELPAFRGVSASYHRNIEYSESGTSFPKAKDLYFPKPFNDEQVRIIQLLDIYDGVAVQGPPGTGKTHTIANVICHFLANGKRVLVTSMKDPALKVLQDQLPDEIQPLVIPLLTSEREGLKKFEYSILKIASGVQSIDRSITLKEIQYLEELINTLHGQLTHIDWNISAWAKKNFNKIILDSVEMSAKDAAHELVSNAGQYEWIPDSINITSEFEPQFNDTDIIELRDARRELGVGIAYLGSSLPELIEFPDMKLVLQTHQDLSKFEQLRREVEKGNIPSLIDTTQNTIDAALALQAQINELKNIRAEFHGLNKGWIGLVKQHLFATVKQDILLLVHNLSDEINTIQELRKIFLAKPVFVPQGIESDKELFEAVSNLSEGKRPFSLIKSIGKSTAKRALGSIQLLGSFPDKVEDWKHVASYLELLSKLKELALRWNAIAQELDLPIVEMTPTGGLQVLEYFLIFQKIQREVELEMSILASAKNLFPVWLNIENVVSDPSLFAELDQALQHHLIQNRLANIWVQKELFQRTLDGRNGPVIDQIREFLSWTLGNPTVSDHEIQAAWSSLMAELSRVLGLRSKLDTVQRVTSLINASGASDFALKLREPLTNAVDELLPSNWRQSWRLRRLATYLQEIDGQEELKALSKDRQNIGSNLAQAYQDVVVKRTWLKLAENASPSVRAALQAYLSAIQKIGKGTGKRAVRYRQDARNAAFQANAAVPCWIMPHYRVSESLPPQIGYFDLVIVDEASQSDLTALPSLLRAKKILIVGDDKQVSPEGVGLEEEKIRNLMGRFLGSQVEIYRPQMSPERSIYDLFKVVFAKSSVMLKEHFRSVGPIIEYSKREFYNHELCPLRRPKISEQLDPPLIDVLLQDGYRNGDENFAEARFIVEEIKAIVSDEQFYKHSIGVVSLLADKQSRLIWEMLIKELGPELLQRHKINCGDARAFQGEQRDIMFLSMIVAPNESRIAPLSRDTYAQRFNVAASRARDRMYLVRSVSLEHLSDADKLRRNLITHFSAPFAQDEERVEDLRKLCESPFEFEMYDALTQRGYWVMPQVRVGQYRIDFVVEGNNGARLAIECDGDKYHGPDKWIEDMDRQRVLERAGWVFWRCFASTWVRRRNEMIEDLTRTLSEHGVEPVGSDFAPRSIHCEQRVFLVSEFSKTNSTKGAVENNFTFE